jgi:Mce-associated membrane protein
MPVGKARRAVKPEPEPSEPEPPDDDEGESVGAAMEPEVSETSQVIFVPARRAPRWSRPAVAVAAVLFVGAGAFAGATVQPYLAERALVDTKLDIARTAADAITALWTYTPDDMESLADRSGRFLGGDFQAQYRKYVDAIVPTNKQAQVSNSTQVVGAAVESVDGGQATAIVYTNSTATSPLSKDIPSLRYLSYRLTMERESTTWLVTSMTTITSLDLTPQL